MLIPSVVSADLMSKDDIRFESVYVRTIFVALPYLSVIAVSQPPVYEKLYPKADDNLPLYRIAYAEARTYFSGSKTLDEVIDVIQSRATLYLQEK